MSTSDAMPTSDIVPITDNKREDEDTRERGMVFDHDRCKYREGKDMSSDVKAGLEQAKDMMDKYPSDAMFNWGWGDFASEHLTYMEVTNNALPIGHKGEPFVIFRVHPAAGRAVGVLTTGTVVEFELTFTVKSITQQGMSSE